MQTNTTIKKTNTTSEEITLPSSTDATTEEISLPSSNNEDPVLKTHKNRYGSMQSTQTMRIVIVWFTVMHRLN